MEETEENKLDVYRSLIEKKERLIKEGNDTWKAYLRCFGDAKVYAYKLQIRCIELKKRISYCQKMVNEGRTINQEEMNMVVDGILDDYEFNLKQLVRDSKDCWRGTPVSFVDLTEIKNLFRKLVKLMHPDLHPKLFNDSEAVVLWGKIQDAYKRNNLNDLRDLEIMVIDFVNKHGEEVQNENIPDIDKRINDLELVILSISTSKPYILRRVLEDKETMIKERDRLTKTINEYEGYALELEKKLGEFKVSTKTKVEVSKSDDLWSNWPYKEEK